MNDAQVLYNYNNFDNYLQQLNIEMPADWLRWFQSVIGTKISLFSYENLPNDLTSEIIEKALVFNNCLCFYNDTAVGFGLYMFKSLQKSNKYWTPSKVDILTLTGTTIATNVDFNDIILVRDNPMDIIPFITLNSWINKIMEVEKTLGMELTWARMPFVLSGSKEQVNAYKQLISKTYKFEPFAIGEKGLVGDMKQFEIHIPIDIISVYDLIEKYVNKAMESIGIYSADKKQERLITAEINAQNDYVDFVYNSMYQQRKHFIDEVNSRYGYNIKLLESYVTNKEDDIEEEKKRQEALLSVEARYSKAIEEVKNEGKVEAAKVSGVDAAKYESKEQGGNSNE
jgi:hypothetical protein